MLLKNKVCYLANVHVTVSTNQEVMYEKASITETYR